MKKQILILSVDGAGYQPEKAPGFKKWFDK
jgi:hypothetical protein